MAGQQTSFQLALGAVARERRRELGLTQEELANEHGMHQRWISNAECARQDLQVESLRRLAAALGLRASELLIRAERREASGR